MKYLFVVLTSTMLIACGGGSGNDTTEVTTSLLTEEASSSQSPPQLDPEELSGQAPINTASPAIPSTSQSASEPNMEVVLPEPAFTLDQPGQAPLRGLVVSGNLVIQPDFEVLLEWQIDKRGVSQCTVTAEEPICTYTITRQDEGHLLRLCSVVGEQRNCSEDKQLPQISFTGLLNYKGEVSAHMVGFSELVETSWYLFSSESFDVDSDGPGNLAPGMNEGLTYRLQDASYTAREYVHKFLIFCVNDRTRRWNTACRVVGDMDSIYPSRQGISTLFPISPEEEKKQQLVGGELLYRSDTVRRIAPVLEIKHEFHSYTSYINRPITLAELAYFQFTLAPVYLTKYLQEKQEIYPSLIYKYEDDEGTRDNPYDEVITTADDLCNSIARRLPAAIHFERSDFTDSGWPMRGYPFGMYWTESQEELGSEYFLATDISTGESYEERYNLPYNVACGHY